LQETFPLLARIRIGRISLECRNSRVPIELIVRRDDKDVHVGATDVATGEVETPEEVAGVIRAAMAHVPPERIYPSTNCGMVPLPARSRAPSSARWERARRWFAPSSAPDPAPDRHPRRVDAAVHAC